MPSSPFFGTIAGGGTDHVYGLAEDVSLYRFHYVCASLECVCARLNIDFRVQSKKFKCVMVPRAIRRSARASINLPACAQLIGTVRQLAPIEIPSGNPVAVPGIFQTSQCNWSSVVHFELPSMSCMCKRKLIRTRGDVGPRYCW